MSADKLVFRGLLTLFAVATTTIILVVAWRENRYATVDVDPALRALVTWRSVENPVSNPRILLFGDSGQTAFAPTIEQALRATPELASATVFPDQTEHSLFDHVRHLRILIHAIHPKAAVVLLAPDTDLVTLLDVTRPHVDNNLIEREALPTPRPNTFGAIQKTVHERVAGDRALDQSGVFYLQPNWLASALARAWFCLEHLRVTCRQERTRLLVVLMPSTLSDPSTDFAREVAAADIPTTLRTAILQRMQRSGISHFDASTLTTETLPAALTTRLTKLLANR